MARKNKKNKKPPKPYVVGSFSSMMPKKRLSRKYISIAAIHRIGENE